MEEYKGVIFLRGNPMKRAVDWVEREGFLKPATVVFRPRMISSPGIEGYFRPERKRIYLYLHSEAVLVHELIHNWQWNGEDYTTLFSGGRGKDTSGEISFRPSGNRGLLSSE